MWKMRKSGYDEAQRREVLISGLRGFERMRKDEEEGKRPVNRPEWMGSRTRRLRRLIGNKTWYKKKKTKEANIRNGRKKKKVELGSKLEDREIETIMFVPYTPNSALCKQLQKIDDDYIEGTKMKRIKMVERVGTMLKDILNRSDPWADEGCEMLDCF